MRAWGQMEADSVGRRFCGPRLFGLVTERSNSCARVGGHAAAADPGGRDRRSNRPSADGFVGAQTGAFVENAVPVIGKKDPSGREKGVQCPHSVEGSCQQGKIRLGEFLSPPGQAYNDRARDAKPARGTVRACARRRDFR